MTIIPKDKIIDTTKEPLDSLGSQVMYQYPTVSFTKSECQVAKTIPKHITTPYHGSSTTPNLSYPRPDNTYKATNIYIYGLIHDNILEVTCDSGGRQFNTDITGELIIEHEILTGSGKLFVCFLLTNVQSVMSEVTSNDVDNMIYFAKTPQDNATSLSVTLQSSLHYQDKAVVYTSNGNTVIVFTAPIYINSDSKDYIATFNTPDTLLTTPLFDKTPKSSQSYQILNEDNIIRKGFDEIYIDCSPTGESAENIATYNVPIESEYTHKNSLIPLMEMTVQLALVFIFLTISYFLSPIMYKALVIDSINKFVLHKAVDNDRFPKLDDNTVTATPVGNRNNLYENSKEFVNNYNTKHPSNRLAYGIDTFIRLASVDAWIGIFFIFIGFAFVTNGFTGKFTFSAVASGLYIFVFFLLSCFTIRLSKLKDSYMQTKVDTNVEGFQFLPSDAKDGSEPNYFYLKDFGVYFPGAVFSFITIGNNGYNLVGIVVLWIILMLFILLLNDPQHVFNSSSQITDETAAQLFFIIGMCIILPGVPLISLLYMSRDDFYKDNPKPVINVK